tara:strand:+ start:12332 stop:12826 length:495 start_codon:yes stop_codon:yes gene_type:complete
MSRTIKQPRGSGLCLAACAATLLAENKSAFNSWALSGFIKQMPVGLEPHLTDRRYMEMSDLTIVFAIRGLRLGSWWNSGDDMSIQFDEVATYSVTHQLDEAPALVIVHPDDSGPGVTHAVVYDNEAQGVRDPSNAVTDDVVPLSNYRIAEWYPIDAFPDDEGLT